MTLRDDEGAQGAGSLAQAVVDLERRIQRLSADAALAERDDAVWWLLHLAQQGDSVNMPAGSGWPVWMRRRARRALKDVLERYQFETDGRDAGPLAAELRDAFSEGDWVQLFSTSRLLSNAQGADDLSVQLWQTHFLRDVWFVGGESLPLVYRALEAEAETHLKDNTGWHLHPLKRDDHTGYRCFFDPKRSQEFLSWELHSSRGKSTDLGNPALAVLSETNSEALYDACLQAVRERNKLAPRGTPFSTWAARFGTPTKHAYVAHPVVTGVKPEAWSVYEPRKCVPCKKRLEGC